MWRIGRCVLLRTLFAWLEEDNVAPHELAIREVFGDHAAVVKAGPLAGPPVAYGAYDSGVPRVPALLLQGVTCSLPGCACQSALAD